MPRKTPASSENSAAKSAVADPKGKGAAGKAKAVNGRTPPAEEFWQRYSPHHEFPLSSGTSVLLHILVLVLLSVAAWVGYQLFGDSKPPDVTAVALENPGGGGSKNGVEGATGAGAASINDDVQAQTDPNKPVSTEDINKDLNVGEADPIKIDIKDDKGRPLSAAAASAMKNLAKVDAEARKKLWNNMAGDKGKGGSGKGGGYGSGIGEGTGTGTGKGKGMSQRQKRVLRWSMTFNTQNGEDYLRQLKDIKPGKGAILAVPIGNRKYEVIRDLAKHPATGQPEDLAQIKSIFWVDEAPESVANLARAMGIKAPAYFVAFFPPELEDELARLEREKSGGAREDDIEETKFNVVKTADGYRPVVISVRKH